MRGSSEVPSLIGAYWEDPAAVSLAGYRARGGYEAARQALTAMKPEDVIEEVRRANLRGRGGAGFPAGLKWSFVPRTSPKPKYLVVNADESEPGTFKDKYIMLRSPHLLIEGAIIAAYAIDAHVAYIYIRGEYDVCRLRLEEALREAYEAGFLGRGIFGTAYDLDIYIHKGAGAYIAGEETGLLESLEGKRAYPRIKPPFPATVGLFRCPTVIHNVETLAYVPFIIRHGGAWFASLGTERNGGFKLYCVSGHVRRPGVYELPMGTSLRTIIEDHAGGVWHGRRLKAVIPGGSSAPVLRADEVDVPADFDALAKAGSMLGSAGIIVMDEMTCMVRALEVIADFYADESCGQCTPCREGAPWLLEMVQDILHGRADPSYPDLLLQVAQNILGRTICALGDAAALPVLSFVRKFRSEFDYHIAHKRCDVEERYGEVSNPD